MSAAAKSEEERRTRLRDNNRRYESRNEEKVRAKKRAWFDKNPEYLKSYYAKNRTRFLVNQAKVRSKKFGVPFSLTVDDVSIPDVCPVLGIPLRMDARGGFNPNSISLDRLVPELGYVKSNVRVISNRANLLKRDATVAEVRALLAYLERELGP